jgi:WD40 repeat protein
MLAEHEVLRLWNIPLGSARPTAVDLHGYDISSGQNTTDKFRAAEFSDDGRWLAAGTASGSVFVLNLQSNIPPTPTRMPASGSAVMKVRIAPRSRYLAVASEDRKVRVWDLETLNQAPTVLSGHEGMVYNLIFPKGDRWMFSVSYAEHRVGYFGDESARRYRFDPTLGAVAPTTFATIPSGGYGPQISANQQWVAINSKGNQTPLVRVPRPGLAGAVRFVDGEPTHQCFSPRSSWFMTIRTGKLLLTNLRDLSDPIPIPLPGDGRDSSGKQITVQYALWDQQEHWLAILASNGSGWLYESQDGTIPTLKTALNKPGATGFMMAGFTMSSAALDWGGDLTFSPDGNWLLGISISTGGIASQNREVVGSARLWDLRSRSNIHDYVLPMSVVHSGAFVGNHLVLSAPNGSAKVWRLPYSSSDQGLSLNAPTSPPYPIDHSNLYVAEPSLVVIFSPSQAFMWDLEHEISLRGNHELTAGKPNGINGYWSAWRQAIFSSHNRWVALVRKTELGNEVIMVRLGKKATLARTLPPVADDSMSHVVFSSDERWLATGGDAFEMARVSENTVVHIWNLSAAEWGQQAITLAAHESTVRSFVFSPNGKYLVSSAIDKGIVKWNLNARDPRRAYSFLQLPMTVKFLSNTDIFMESATERLIGVTETDSETGKEMTKIESFVLDPRLFSSDLASVVGRDLSANEHYRYLNSGSNKPDGPTAEVALVRQQRNGLINALSNTEIAKLNPRKIDTGNLLAAKPRAPILDDSDLHQRRDDLENELRTMNATIASLRWWHLKAIMQSIATTRTDRR